MFLISSLKGGFPCGFRLEKNHLAKDSHLWNHKWAILIRGKVIVPSFIQKMLVFLWRIIARGRTYHHTATICSQSVCLSDSFKILMLFTAKQGDIVPCSSWTYVFNQKISSYFSYHNNDTSFKRIPWWRLLESSNFPIHGTQQARFTATALRRPKKVRATPCFEQQHI